jgi:thiol:disulfide interchange protein DsbD
LTIGALLLPLFLAPLRASAQTPIHWSMAAVSKAPMTAGRTFDVELTAEVDPGWHLYALSEPTGGPEALVISVAKGGPFSLGGSIVEPVPKSAFDSNFNLETQYHEERAVFTVPVRVAAGTANGRYTLHVDAAYQTCNDRFCLPPRIEGLTLAVAVGTGVIPPAPGGSDHSAAPGARPNSSNPRAPNLDPPPSEPARILPKTLVVPAEPLKPDTIVEAKPLDAPPAHVVDLASANSASTLGAYISLAAVMGALSLLTPCVFPMVPITVSYFTRSAGRSRRDAVQQALVYGLGIVLTFTAVGFTLAVAFGASGLNRFAADPWLNLGVTALFVGFALSLFGVYELAIPSSVLTAASKADAGRGRYVGTALMGLAFTLTSFTCTAPFLGTLLVVASQGNWQWPLAGMLAFSAVFALPFVVLALAPQWLASLPKSGTWLIAVKAVMGLLELAAAMKFLSNVDLVWGWHIVTRPVVLVTWIVIGVALVAYLAGWLRLGRVRLARPGLGRLTAIAGGILLGLWLASGLAGRRLGELEAFLPPADLMGGTQGSELSWILNDWDKGLAEAKRLSAPILVDFTGYTCTNCRWMEANMFPLPEVTRELARFVRVRLYTDGRGEMYRQYQDMEQRLFGTVALPYYAVFTSEGRPVVAFGGLTRSSAEYVAFLRKGLE